MLLPLAGGSGTVVKFGEFIMILELHRQGLKVAAIARQLGVDRKTVRKYISRGSARRPGRCAMNAHPEIVHSRPGRRCVGRQAHYRPMPQLNRRSRRSSVAVDRRNTELLIAQTADRRPRQVGKIARPKVRRFRGPLTAGACNRKKNCNV